MATNGLDTVTVPHLIGGEWYPGNGDEVVRANPACPSDVVARFRRAAESDLDKAIQAAQGARRTWRNAPWHERASVLARAADLLDDRAPALGAELTREEGKTLREGTGEVRRAARTLRYFASEAERDIGELFASSRQGERIISIRSALGVVGVVTPWNFPMAIPAWKIAPALIYGNAVVWKPAELVPLLAYRLAQALMEAGLPSGVLNVILAPGSSIGRALTVHPGIDAVTFTGSSAVGRWVIAECGRTAKPVQAEMGGKNVAIILSDASINEAADHVVRGAMESTGQKCTATSRLIVEEPVADQVLHEVASRVKAWRTGDGLQPAVDMGPAVSADAQAAIMAAVRSAIGDGARLVASGGEPLAMTAPDGHFVAPNVLTIDDTAAPIWQDEVFGPVLAVKRAATWDECLDLANSTRYGLTASLYTRDIGRALSAIDHLEVGIVHINSETTGAEPHVPFGGSKESGYGPREQGRAAREFFSKTQTVYLRAAAPL